MKSRRGKTLIPLNYSLAVEIPRVEATVTNISQQASSIAKRLPFIATVLAICAGSMLLFAMLAGLVEPLPFWARMALLFILPIVVLSGLGSLAYWLGAPRGWLMLVTGGLLLSLAPVLLYWVHGSWEAEFTVPRRAGRTSTFGVDSFGLWAVLIGGLLATIGSINYLRGHRKKLHGERSLAQHPEQ